MVAEAPAGLILQDRLADEPQVTGDRKPDVRQAELDELAITCGAAVPFRSQDRRRGQEPGHCIPSRQHVVHGAVGAFGSGDVGEAEGGVDRVVHRRAAISAAGDHEHDQVGPQLLELLVRVPTRYG